MVGLSHLSIVGVCVTGCAIAAIAALPNILFPAIAQQSSQGQTSTNFSDTRNTWAQPFITALAQRDVLNGYPDGTFRPNRPVERDEFAAVIREAFNQKPERNISSGSAYRDVPKGYWAAPAIEEAYEMGFMRGYPNNTFRPTQPVTRAEALTSLARNLELAQRVPSVAQKTRSEAQATPSTQAAQPNTQATPPQRARRQIFFPIAALSLMQPLMRAPATTAQSAQPTAPTSVAKNSTTQVPANKTLSSYYDDADRIPQYARDPIAAVTRAGMVVNYPNQRLLNPNQPATRADIAAFIHQALVNKGQVPPLADNVAASRYVVGREALNSNNPSQNNNQSRNN